MANEINNKYIYSRPSLISLVWDESHIEPRVFANKIPVIIKPQPQSQPHPQQSSEEYLYYYTQLQQGVVYTISQYEEITLITLPCPVAMTMLSDISQSQAFSQTHAQRRKTIWEKDSQNLHSLRSFLFVSSPEIKKVRKKWGSRLQIGRASCRERV